MFNQTQILVKVNIILKYLILGLILKENKFYLVFLYVYPLYHGLYLILMLFKHLLFF